MSDVTFTSIGGRSPERIVLDIAQNARPTDGDALFAIQRQRTRILERTLNGVDVDGKPFAPYSQAGPYYYYPNGRVGRNKAEQVRNKAAVSRLLRRLADTGDRAGSIGAKTGSGGVKTRGGEGIRFESYADFKISLGRSGVDLRGPRAPHMLQALAVGVGIARIIGDDRNIGLNEMPQRATEAVLGIYGDEAGRAVGHNTGNNPRWKGRHQRRFLGASAADIEAMKADITGRVVTRIQAAIPK